MTSSVLYFWVSLADFLSFLFPFSEHPITHEPKDTIEDYLSQLFQLIAAKESAGEQAWCEKWFVRFEQPRFWFLNVQINSLAGLGVLSAACSVCDGARLEEVPNVALFPEGPPGVAAVTMWMQTVFFFFLYTSEWCFKVTVVIVHYTIKITFWSWGFVVGLNLFFCQQTRILPASLLVVFLISTVLANERHQKNIIWFLL